MQISVDVVTTPVRVLRQLIGFLVAFANEREALEAALPKDDDARIPHHPRAPVAPSPLSDGALSLPPVPLIPLPPPNMFKGTIPPPPPPVAPVVAPTAAAPAGEVDAKGFTWDGRIHSETRKRNADGTWRLRRNLEKSTLDEVMAELRAKLGDAAPPVPLPPQVPAPPAPIAPANETGRAAGVLDGALQSAEAPTFKTLMQMVSPALTGGKITSDTLIAVCRKHGAENLQVLVQKPEIVPAVYNELKGLCA